MVRIPFASPRIGMITALAVMLLSVGCVGPGQTGQQGRQGQKNTRAQGYIEQGQRYLNQDREDAALASFGLALEDNPNLIEAQMGTGTIWRQRGDYQKAKRAYQKATRIEPNNFDARYYLGLMHQLLGEVGDAISTYLQALGINPDSVKANRDLAAAYLQAGRPEAAITYAKRASGLDPQSKRIWANLAAAYSLAGQYQHAVDAYRQAAEFGRLESPVLLGLADSHIKLGHYVRAINTLRALIRNDPSATAYERLGYAQFKRHRFEDALANFDRALKDNPQDTAALNGKGVAYMTLYIETGRTNNYQHNQAVEAWRKSLRIQPNQPRITDLLTRYGGQ